MLKLLFFAKYRELLGIDTMDFPINKALTIKQLVKQLSEKNATWQSVFSQTNLMVAVNQNMSNFDTHVTSGDEVAFFPPVSGG